MSSAAAQAKAQALNAKLEGEARFMLDELEKKHLRKIARESHACALKCYDKAGASGGPEALENCVRNCQVPYQQSNAYVQNEVGQFQNRLNRAMEECQDQARDLMQPGYENDAKKMDMVETKLLSCMQKSVDSHIALLKPLKQRIIAQLK